MAWEKKMQNAVLKLQTLKVGQLEMLILFAAGFHFILNKRAI